MSQNKTHGSSMFEGHIKMAACVIYPFKNKLIDNSTFLFSKKNIENSYNKMIFDFYGSCYFN